MTEPDRLVSCRYFLVHLSWVILENHVCLTIKYQKPHSYKRSRSRPEFFERLSRWRTHTALLIRTVHNAVDLERFNPRGPLLDLDALSGLLPAANRTVRVGLVATMARWKGHEVFLRALSMLPKDLPVRGYVIGGPIYATQGSQYSLDELRSLASGLGLNGKVAFTGYVDDSAPAMRALDNPSTCGRYRY